MENEILATTRQPELTAAGLRLREIIARVMIEAPSSGTRKKWKSHVEFPNPSTADRSLLLIRRPRTDATGNKREGLRQCSLSKALRGGIPSSN
jgi:hypothetical protein